MMMCGCENFGVQKMPIESDGIPLALIALKTLFMAVSDASHPYTVPEQFANSIKLSRIKIIHLLSTSASLFSMTKEKNEFCLSIDVPRIIVLH